MAEAEGKRVGYYLSWENIGCGIGRRTILEGVSGYCAPGNSLCVLGASGSGKTTLVDILSHRKTVGNVTGTVLVNGMKPDRNYKRQIGYVTAETTHIPTMTVRETLMFAAELKMPGNPTYDERVKRVDELMEGLKISHIANTAVGNELLRGISSGEKKRVDIGIELLGEPKLLFLDEPTSGLDEYSSKFTMSLILQYIKKQDVTVICVIHQPSLGVYQLFDSVCLLGEGHVCYFGTVSYAETFFTKMGQPTPEYVNPIEHYMDVVAAAPHEVTKYYDASDLYKQNIAKIKDISGVIGSVANFETASDRLPLNRRTIFDQTRILFVRMLFRYHRNPSTSYGRIINGYISALIYGCVFFNLSQDLTGFRLRLGLSGGIGFIPAFTASAAVPQFLDDRDLYIQEFDSGMYSTLPYYLTYLLIENIVLIIIAVPQAVIIFAMAGLPMSTFSSFIQILVLQSIISVSVAQCVSSFCKTQMQAFSAMVAYGLINYVFSGIQVNIKTLNNSFLLFLSTIDYWRYTITKMVSIEMDAMTLVCTQSQKIPMVMDHLVQVLAPGVLAGMSYGMPDGYPHLNATMLFGWHLPLYHDMDGLTWLQSILATNAGNGNLIINQTALPISSLNHQYAPSLLTEIQTAWTTSNSLNGNNASAVAAALTLNSRDLQAWLNALQLVGTNVYPDFSACPIQDVHTYISTNFGVDDWVNNNTVWISFVFFAVYATLAYFGLIFSRRYKKR